jgi:integrase/recombinase XerD
VRQLSATTRRTRAAALRLFASWLEERGVTAAAQVTRPMVLAYQRHLAQAPAPGGNRGNADGRLAISTQRMRLGVLMAFGRWAVRAGHLNSNPASDLDLPRPMRALPETLAPAEVDRVLAQVDLSAAGGVGVRDRALLELLYATGMRRMEAISLRLDDIDAARRLVRIRHGKGGKDRIVPIGTRALAWLARWLVAREALPGADQPSAPLWLRPDGKPLTIDALSIRVRKYVEGAGYAPRGACHLFRHACATHLLENGCDVRLIQELLGHARLDTTALYTRVTIRHLQAAYAACHPAERAAAEAAISETPSSP